MSGYLDPFMGANNPPSFYDDGDSQAYTNDYEPFSFVNAPSDKGFNGAFDQESYAESHTQLNDEPSSSSQPMFNSSDLVTSSSSSGTAASAPQTAYGAQHARGAQASYEIQAADDIQSHGDIHFVGDDKDEDSVQDVADQEAAPQNAVMAPGGEGHQPPTPRTIYAMQHLPASVGFHPELGRMYAKNPDFIPTFDREAMFAMTGRTVVNSVSGNEPIAPAVPFDDESLQALRQKLPFDMNTVGVDEIANLGHNVLDLLAQQPVISQLLELYRYEPDCEGENINVILPKIGAALKKNESLLAYYQLPLEKEGNEEKEELEGSDLEDDAASNGQASGDQKESMLKYNPIKVQYKPYRFLFKTEQEARNHRKKVRRDPKIAHDIERVKKHGRYYWTKRIYEAMINVDLAFDNKESAILTYFAKMHHFDEEDLEATANHIFDKCIKIHEVGWNRYIYNHKEFKRGNNYDTFRDSIEKRLERICGILKHSKALANDCILGGDLLMQTCDNPIFRANTKTANNKGNMERQGRLKNALTERQRAKQAEQAAKREANRRRREERRAAQRASRAQETPAPEAPAQEMPVQVPTHQLQAN